MNALVKAQNLSYKINDKKLFQGVSFELFKGKALHIQGENGSGKTTLLRVVCGLTKPTKGDLITLTDKEVCFIGHKNAIKQYLRGMSRRNFILRKALTCTIALVSSQRLYHGVLKSEMSSLMTTPEEGRLAKLLS